MFYLCQIIFACMVVPWIYIGLIYIFNLSIHRFSWTPFIQPALELLLIQTQALSSKYVYEYNRFIWKDKAYDTAAYTWSSKRQNCMVKAHDNNTAIYCQIKNLVTLKQCCCLIAHHKECECEKCYLLFCMPYNVVSRKLFSCGHFRIQSTFLLEVQERSEAVVVLPLEAIITKCVKIVKGQKTFLVDMPNMVEMEWVLCIYCNIFNRYLSVRQGGRVVHPNTKPSRQCCE